MKISFSWIFDHIIGSYKDYDIDLVVDLFNKTTAEIERVDRLSLNLDHFFVIKVIKITEKNVTVFCTQLHKEITLSPRPGQALGKHFIIFYHNNEGRWATFADWSGSKEGLLPAVSVTESEAKGDWRKKIVTDDVILTLENKSITHRPDLWSHRGIAREIAALLHLKLVPEHDLIADNEVVDAQKNDLAVAITNAFLCKKFSALYVPALSNIDSTIFMMHRLIALDAHPINAIVDATNYVMFDIGQPLHAFDAQKLSSRTLNVRSAKQGESLTLLDGQSITLTDEDIVVADTQKPLALAGIMGGMSSAINEKTTAIILEAACFNPATIRKSATRYKKRTEASARFEKSIDPTQTIYALKRCLSLLQQAGIVIPQCFLATVGSDLLPHTVSLTHARIESKLGIVVLSSSVVTILESIGFRVTVTVDGVEKKYDVLVPTFRGTKEPMVAEDIIEEIGRFVGYNTIPFIAPTMPMGFFYNPVPSRIYESKFFFSFAMRAREVMNYAFFDEEFLFLLKWQPEDSVGILNPVSQHWKRVVTSLVPHLLKNVYANKFEHQPLRFFEFNRIWVKKNDQIKEQKNIAALFYDKKEVSFYENKELLVNFFNAFKIPVVWVKNTQPLPVWYHPYQTAVLMANETILGYAGKIDPLFLKNVVDGGDAFVIELNGEIIENFIPKPSIFKPLSKFPSTWWDISMYVPLALTIDTLMEYIKNSDARIFKTELIDYFEKEEWLDYRAATVRFYAKDEARTLSKEEIDHIYNHVIVTLKKNNVTVR